MKVVCYIEREREWKTRVFMQAFAQGARQKDTAVAVEGKEIKGADVHVIWGHRWFAEKAIPELEANKQKYIVVDNGWFDPANGRQQGYFRVMLNGPENPVWPDMPGDRVQRLNVKMLPWSQGGDKILICMPGPHYGLPWKLPILDWEMKIVDEVRKHTDREIIVRRKGSTTPFLHDLREAWALVTHSSGVAVTAATMGVPVFCEPTCAAHPVRAGELSDLEHPLFPERDEWLRSLTYQQWDLNEYNTGKAWETIRRKLV